MIILHRDISPAASFQTDITQHLPGSKRNVPDVIPGQGKISRFSCQRGIVVMFRTIVINDK